MVYMTLPLTIGLFSARYDWTGIRGLKEVQDG